MVWPNSVQRVASSLTPFQTFYPIGAASCVNVRLTAALLLVGAPIDMVSCVETIIEPTYRRERPAGSGAQLGPCLVLHKIRRSSPPSRPAAGVCQELGGRETARGIRASAQVLIDRARREAKAASDPDPPQLAAAFERANGRD